MKKDLGCINVYNQFQSIYIYIYIHIIIHFISFHHNGLFVFKIPKDHQNYKTSESKSKSTVVTIKRISHIL